MTIAWLESIAPLKSPEFTPDEDIVSIDLVDEGKMLMFILLRFLSADYSMFILK